MDIHRCRFVDYNPSTINALAFSHPLPKNALSTRLSSSLRLAIGRINGSIEIWNPLHNWFHESTLHGGEERTIEGLAWIREDHTSIRAEGEKLGRLFSIGYSTVVTEWDINAGRPLKHFDVGKGVIWSIAARSEGKADDGEEFGGQLVVGCEDGSLVVINTDGGPGSMAYARTITQTRIARVLSLAYQNPHTIVAGMADSRIRVFDTRSGRTTATMTVGAKDVHIWRVKCTLNQNWIIAADSRGEVTFWDGKRYVLRQRIKAHNSDVMTVEINSRGDKVYSAGTDMRMVEYTLLGGGENGRIRKEWAQTCHRRFHKHDVLAMAAYEAGGFSVIVSGGKDTTPIINPMRQFAKEHHRTLPLVPQTPIVTTAPEGRLVVAHFERDVKVWRMDDLDVPSEVDEDELYGMKGRRLVAKIQLSGEENITSSDISADGSLLAVSTIAAIKLFDLRPRKSQRHALKVTKHSLDSAVASLGARIVRFTKDGKWLCIVTPKSQIQVIRLDLELPVEVNVLERLEREYGQASKKMSVKNGVLGLGEEYGSQIHRVAFSTDGMYLAVTDLAGYTDCWELSDITNSWKPLLSPLPRLDAPAVAMAFRPVHQEPTPVQQAIEELDQDPPSTARATSLQLLHDLNSQSLETTSPPQNNSIGLFFLTCNHTLYEFNVLTGQLTSWSKRNPSDKLPKNFTKIMDRGCGMCFSRNGTRLWLWGATWVWMFDIERDLPAPSSVENDAAAAISAHDRKRKRPGDGAAKPEIEEGDHNVVKMSGAGGQIPLRSALVIPDVFEEGEKVEIHGLGSPNLTSSLRRQKKMELQQTLTPPRSLSDRNDGDENNDDDSPGDEDNAGNDDDNDDEDDENEEFLIDHAKSRTSFQDTIDLSVALREDQVATVNGDSGNANANKVKQKRQRPYWYTMNYRPLLGFLPIGREDAERTEMVVIERPLDDVPLPERYKVGRDQ